MSRISYVVFDILACLKYHSVRNNIKIQRKKAWNSRKRMAFFDLIKFTHG